jgi:hypothetical protein
VNLLVVLVLIRDGLFESHGRSARVPWTVRDPPTDGPSWLGRFA